VGADNLCHQAIFVDHAAGAVAPLYPEMVQAGDAIWQRAQWRCLPEGSVRPVGVVEVLVLAQDGHQMPLVPDHPWSPRVASLFAGNRVCQRTDGGIVTGPRGLVLPAGPRACPGIFGGGVKDARADRVSKGGKYPAHVLSGRGSMGIGYGRPAAQRRARPGPGRQLGR